MRINQNVMALNAYRSLTTSNAATGKSIEKLSSGFRINRAADDAAGLVVSQKLRAQVSGLKTAVRNAQDGISVVQIAEGALTEVHTMLNRMRDLAVQASNTGSMDAGAVSAAQAEIDELALEITRISDTTTFGSTKLLDGSYGVKAADATGTAAGGTFTSAAADSFTINVAGSGAVTVELAALSAVPLSEAASHIESRIKGALLSGTTAQAAYAEEVSVTVDGNELSIKVGGLDVGQTFVLADGTNTPLAANFGGVPTATLTSGTGGVFQIGANSGETVSVSIADMDAAALSVNALSLETGAGAAITALDAAIDTVSETRSNLGAAQNRFESMISNLQVTIENVSASESRIRDTDMAAEMTTFTRNQILLQAGTAMLAQANSVPQAVLQLLQ